MIVEDNTPRNHWPHGIVDETFEGKDGRVRRVKVRMANPGIDNQGKPIQPNFTLERPIQKLVLQN